MLKEFKEFAIKGNVVDMAVGIIIGAAFGTIVKSLVADVIMPPIGLLLGGVDFANMFVVLKAGADMVGPYETLAMAQEAGAAREGSLAGEARGIAGGVPILPSVEGTHRQPLVVGGDQLLLEGRPLEVLLDGSQPVLQGNRREVVAQLERADSHDDIS